MRPQQRQPGCNTGHHQLPSSLSPPNPKMLAGELHRGHSHSAELLPWKERRCRGSCGATNTPLKYIRHRQPLVRPSPQEAQHPCSHTYRLCGSHNLSLDSTTHTGVRTLPSMSSTPQDTLTPPAKQGCQHPLAALTGGQRCDCSMFPRTTLQTCTQHLSPVPASSTLSSPAIRRRMRPRQTPASTPNHGNTRPCDRDP